MLMMVHSLAWWSRQDAEENKRVEENNRFLLQQQLPLGLVVWFVDFSVFCVGQWFLPHDFNRLRRLRMRRRGDAVAVPLGRQMVDGVSLRLLVSFRN